MNEKMEALVLIDSGSRGSWKFMRDGDRDADTLYYSLQDSENSNLGSVIHRCLIHSVTDKRSLRVGDTLSDTDWH